MLWLNRIFWTLGRLLLRLRYRVSRDGFEQLRELEGPVLVLPANVDVPGVDEEWASEASATLFARYLDLEPNLEVISSEEARSRLEKSASRSSGSL